MAIVYHDDNEGRVPHAHVIVNNTNLVTGRRLQDPRPKELNHLLQKLAAQRNLRDFDTPERQAKARGAKHQAQPKTMQAEYLRKAEAEIAKDGGYSWVTDVRGRVALARSAAKSEAEFKALLAQIGVEVADNSPKAERRDWVYALAGHGTWRVSGERLGLSYGKETMRRRFSAGSLLGDASRERLADIARSAYEVGDIAELRQLSQAVRWAERHRVRCIDDLMVGERRASRAAGSRLDPARIRAPSPTCTAHCDPQTKQALQRDQGARLDARGRRPGGGSARSNPATAPGPNPKREVMQ